MERDNFLWDLYTAGCPRKEVEVVVAAGSTDGLAEVDGGQRSRKRRREALFPVSLLRSSLSMAVESSGACKESDRLHILNRMIESGDLTAPLPPSHPRYAELNHTLRGTFAAVGIRKAFAEQADADLHSAFMDALSADATVRELHLDLEGCKHLTVAGAAQLAASPEEMWRPMSGRRVQECGTCISPSGGGLMVEQLDAVGDK